MDALIHQESRDMVKKCFPPSEYGASYPDLGIASDVTPPIYRWSYGHYVNARSDVIARSDSS